MGKLLTIPQNISMKRNTRLQHDMKASPSKTVERKLTITKKLTHFHARKQHHFNVSSSTDSLLHRLSCLSISLFFSPPFPTFLSTVHSLLSLLLCICLPCSLQRDTQPSFALRQVFCSKTEQALKHYNANKRAKGAICNGNSSI